jgi:FtsP/CotA-like multicopper oxidase with cupredoxin domain
MTFRGSVAHAGRSLTDAWRKTFETALRSTSMATDIHPDLEQPTATDGIDYHQAEGIVPAAPTALEDRKAWREWMMIAIGLVGLLAVLAVVVAAVAFAGRDSGSGETTTIVKRSAAATPAAATAPTLADAKGVAFEKYQKVDPTLPAVPAGSVKAFTVDVLQHVTQVDRQLAPTEAWSYAVNGKTYRGTAASPPIVVNQGDRVKVTFVNGSTKAMGVTMPHSIDFHSAEVAPNKSYIDIAAGKKLTISFVAKHPGVFMYHCATQPVLMHTSAGMMGMMVVKPRNLPPVDRELWLTQEEFYLGAPGKSADMKKMSAETPDVIAFNGYANQYKASPITVRRGERIRMYVLDAGPSKWSAFHVIGTVFDRTYVEGVVGHDSQTVSFAPSQGGWVEFTLDQEGNFPFVTHAFGDMVKGAAGILHTTGAPKVAAPEAAPKAAAKADVNVTLGDMWVKSDRPSVKAGKVSFAVKNAGATIHGLAIVATPAKVSGGMLDHHSLLAEGAELAAGASGTVTASLKSGSYELVCHLPGHYAAGQHMAFDVK